MNPAPVAPGALALPAAGCSPEPPAPRHYIPKATVALNAQLTR
ncbi:hypothetical protein [Aquabacterium humicola]|nr:hypothetical protein [Rubrivivax pictus]